MDMIAHLTRQAAFSRATFGPGPRTEGVSEHIREELDEVGAVYATAPYHDKEKALRCSIHDFAALEWTDVVILGLDGLLRAIWEANPDWTSVQVAEKAVSLLLQKQGKNEKRVWPDWRKCGQDQPIGHIEQREDAYREHFEPVLDWEGTTSGLHRVTRGLHASPPKEKSDNPRKKYFCFSWIPNKTLRYWDK